MNDANISNELPNIILAQTPVLLVSLGGLILALGLRRKAPTASLWAAGAFALGIVTCVLAGVGQAARNGVTPIIVPMLRAVSLVFLLVGVYAGRTDLSTVSAGSPAEPLGRV